MSRFIPVLCLMIVCLLFVTSGCSKVPSDPKVLAAKSHEILNASCARCHGPQKRVFDLSNREELLAKKSPKRNLLFLVPGKPDESAIWKVLEEDQMPPASPKLNSEQKRILRKWIEAGAPAS
jgi:mono/diheme cytochrome c family protein